MSMEKTVYITEKEREMCYKVIGAFAELYEMEDEDILVVNKDAGVPIHPSQGHFDHTLANAVAWYYQSKGQTLVYRAINRLDRDTTGLLVIAKHLLAGCILSDQMLNRQIHRQYRAIVCGKTEKEGIIDAPIGRAEDSTVLRRIDFEHGETARTRYRLLSYDEEKDLSYISLKLDTGRTHQIRVHMSYIGHPLPGDFLYNPDYRYISRQPLHSYGLKFIHPLTGEPLSFTAHLPADMAALVKEPELTSRPFNFFILFFEHSICPHFSAFPISTRSRSRLLQGTCPHSRSVLPCIRLPGEQQDLSQDSSVCRKCRPCDQRRI